MEEVRPLETEDPDRAIALYQQIIKRFPFKEMAYDRVMILLRKQKAYKEELRFIDVAIKTFNSHFGKPSVHAGKRKVASLSRSLQKSLGLKNDKQDILSQFQPIGRWQKRKMISEKRLRSAKK